MVRPAGRYKHDKHGEKPRLIKKDPPPKPEAPKVDGPRKKPGESIAVHGKTETMHGEPGEAVQLPGSNLPPVSGKPKKGI